MRKKKFLLYSFVFILFLAVGGICSQIPRQECSYESVILDELAKKDSEVYEKPELKEGTLINLNTASVGELISLSGIGESLSKRIISFREENGKFEKIEDIMKVPGIGEQKFNNIKNYITVE